MSVYAKGGDKRRGRPVREAVGGGGGIRSMLMTRIVSEGQQANAEACLLACVLSLSLATVPLRCSPNRRSAGTDVPYSVLILFSPRLSL